MTKYEFFSKIIYQAHQNWSGDFVISYKHSHRTDDNHIIKITNIADPTEVLHIYFGEFQGNPCICFRDDKNVSLTFLKI